MRKKATLPSVIAFVVALVGILSFFIPYASLQDEEHRDSLNEFGEMEVVDDVDMTLGDMVDPSLFTLTKIYVQGVDSIWNGDEAAYIVGGIYGAIGVFAVLAALFALARRPILMLLSDLIMFGAFWFGKIFAEESGVMASYIAPRDWSMGYYLYYPVAVILVICAIWMLVAKRMDKKALN